MREALAAMCDMGTSRSDLRVLMRMGVAETEWLVAEAEAVTPVT